MANPALKKREEVITDLKDAGFDARQSRGVVQAVVDTTASLGLATRADLARAVAALNGKINALKAEIAAVKAELKAEVRELRQILIWGLVIGFSWLPVLLMALGWLVKTS